MIKQFVYASLFTAIMLVIVPLIVHGEPELTKPVKPKTFNCQIHSNHQIHEFQGCYFVDDETIFWSDEK